MIALVTGASSGIGRDMARYLNSLNYDLIIVAKNTDKLNELKKELNEKNNNIVDVISADLAVESECVRVHKEVKNKYSNIDFLINNAGFGLFGTFEETDLHKELEMIDVNIKAVHILTKLFLNDMMEINKGRILNVASVAGFLPGPLMNTYYSTKNYVLRFSEAIREELHKKKSSVKINVLCPGPVNTNFNNVAGVKFNLHSLSSEYVAKYAIDKALRNKFMIMPGLSVKFARLGSKIVPDWILAKCCYYAQKKKTK